MASTRDVVVVGYDATPKSEPALRFALREAARTGSALHVVTAWKTMPYIAAVPTLGYEPVTVQAEAERALTQAAEDGVAKAVADTGADHVRIDHQVRPGDAAAQLVEASHKADLVVLGTRHHGTVVSALVGGATNRVLHHASCPVVVVAADAPVSWRQVVVGVDGSDSSLEALRFGASQAVGAGCPLLVLHAWEVMTSPDWVLVPVPEPHLYDDQVRRWLDDLVRTTLGDGAGRVETRSTQGMTASVLLDAAGPDDLLVVGARGRSRFNDLLLGSVSQTCLHHANGSVAVLRENRDAR